MPSTSASKADGESDEAGTRTALDLIKRNIEQSGFHYYVVAGNGPTPRFSYTIGLRESLGAEFVLAGAPCRSL